MSSPSPSTTSSTSNSAPSYSPLSMIKSRIVGQRIKCTLNDGRITEGTLICLDRMKNMILTNATEERIIRKSLYSVISKKGERNIIANSAINGAMKERTNSVENGEGIDGHGNNNEEEWFTFRRDISQVLVPGEKLIKVEIERRLLES